MAYTYSDGLTGQAADKRLEILAISGWHFLFFQLPADAQLRAPRPRRIS